MSAELGPEPRGFETGLLNSVTGLSQQSFLEIFRLTPPSRVRHHLTAGGTATGGGCGEAE